ncbi:MAG: hypothetical protein IPJ54_03100 [Saprospiraceae bacterium]|nr:hypothetical protein [Saprospiraceae bacterium]
MEDFAKTQNTLSEMAATRLLSAARWARIYGLIMCVFSGLGLVMLLLSITALVSFSSLIGGREMGVVSGMFFIYIVVLVFMLYLNYQLVIFGGNIKNGIHSGDELFLENGFARLSQYFKIISMLMLAVVILVALSFLMVLAIGGIGALMAPDAPVYPKDSF